MAAKNRVPTAEDLRRVRQELQALQSELRRVAQIPPSSDEVVARVKRRVEHEAARARLPQHPRELPQNGDSRDPLIGVLDAQGAGDRAAVSAALCAIFGEQVEAALLERVLPHVSEEGIDEGGRAQRLEELARQAVSIEVREEELVRGIREGGVHVERRADARPELVLADAPSGDLLERGPTEAELGLMAERWRDLEAEARDSHGAARSADARWRREREALDRLEAERRRALRVPGTRPNAEFDAILEQRRLELDRLATERDEATQRARPRRRLADACAEFLRQHGIDPTRRKWVRPADGISAPHTTHSELTHF